MRDALPAESGFSPHDRAQQIVIIMGHSKGRPSTIHLRQAGGTLGPPLWTDLPSVNQMVKAPGPLLQERLSILVAYILEDFHRSR